MDTTNTKNPMADDLTDEDVARLLHEADTKARDEALAGMTYDPKVARSINRRWAR